MHEPSLCYELSAAQEASTFYIVDTRDGRGSDVMGILVNDLYFFLHWRSKHVTPTTFPQSQVPPTAIILEVLP